MADPIKAIVAENTPDQGRMPSQDDPANYNFWADWHEERANEVAAAPPGETQGERLGQLQGELDHRASAETFRRRMEQLQDQPEEKIGRPEILEDTEAAFRDFGIPEELADYAVTAGKLTEMKDAADRESFYEEIAATKWELADSFSSRGVPRELDPVKEWKQAIKVAGERFEEQRQSAQTAAAPAPKPGLPTPAATAAKSEAKGSQVKAGLAMATQHWTLSQQDVRQRFPLITDNRQADKIARAGTWRAALIAQIPSPVQRRLGLDPERTYNNAVEKAYAKTIDKQRDALLSERTKALTTLRGVDSRIPPHLLPSKQYRAAERLTQIDQRLRQLSPLDQAGYGAAVKAAGVATLAAQEAPQQAPENAQTAAAVQVKTQAAEPVQAVPIAPAVGPSKHELALQAVRELRAQTPVDGYRSKAADAMANRIVQQLQEGRETVSLSAKYAGGDQGQATSTHANAVEANKQLIEAVRGQGIAVDTGRGMLATAKKAEVELSSQAEQDLAQQSL